MVKSTVSPLPAGYAGTGRRPGDRLRSSETGIRFIIFGNRPLATTIIVDIYIYSKLMSFQDTPLFIKHERTELEAIGAQAPLTPDPSTSTTHIHAARCPRSFAMD